MELPEKQCTRDLVGFLNEFAHQHQIANMEQPQFTVSYNVFREVAAQVTFPRVNDVFLGEGLQGPNYQIFPDLGMDDNEVDVVRSRSVDW